MAQATVVGDPGGLGGLVRQIRLNRQEGRQSRLDDQNSITRGLQQQQLRGNIQAQQGKISNLAANRQLQIDLQTEIRNNPDKDPDFVSLNFLKTRDPAKAAEFSKMIFTKVGQVAKLNPKEAVDMLNTKTGSNITYVGKDPKTGYEKINDGVSIKFLDPANNFKVLKEFPVTKPDPFEETTTIDPTTGKVTITKGRKKKFSEGQLKSGGFADRVKRSNKILTDLEDKKDFNPAALGESIATNIPLIGNALLSPDRQRYEQSKRDFITAVLRLESGAAISDGEFVREEAKYFPQVGDSPEVIAQKRDSREKQFDILKAGGAGSFEQIQAERATDTQSGAVTEKTVIVTKHPTLGDVTEEDIIETMRVNNLTREQVLERIGQ